TSITFAGGISTLYEIVGVRFKRLGKIYYFDPNKIELQVNNYVIVETSKGVEYGKVVMINKQVSAEDIVLPLKKVIRIANERDKDIVVENKRYAKEAHQIGTKKTVEHQLEMKIVDVEYTFDRNKLVFYFTAEGRIDFRDLVKDLASVFRTRIELRQIGVRDEAKMLGGIGPCGRIICCSSFLGDFEPVSIKMAKDQNLSLNPTKISGACGRLMCCLKYENDYYEEARAQLPDVGDVIETPEGNGKVVGLNILDISMQVKVEGLEQPLEYKMEELETLK